MDLQAYFQIIKTTDAELKGYRNLDRKIKEKITPIFELTRSRTTSKVPLGDIGRRLDNILDAVEGLPFILDLTSHEDLMNYQIEDLLDEANGFENWVDFVSSLPANQVIPAIHLVEGCHPLNLSKQLLRIAGSFEYFSLRVSIYDDDLTTYLHQIQHVLGDAIGRLILVLDAEFIDGTTAAKSEAYTEKAIEITVKVSASIIVVVAGSSFPKYVVSAPGCADDAGNILIREWELFNNLRVRYPDIAYGDYGAIHPIRTQQGGGSWVPRIDFPLSDRIIYTRYRQEDGGYEQCGAQLVAHGDYDGIKCWGSEQIMLAATDGAPGRSPAYWISVRLNIHSTRKVSDIFDIGTERFLA